MDTGDYIVYMNNSSTGDGVEGSGGPGGSGGHNVSVKTKNPDSTDNLENISQNKSAEKSKEVTLDELRWNIASYERDI
jgi:hypothetical protein